MNLQSPLSISRSASFLCIAGLAAWGTLAHGQALMSAGTNSTAGHATTASAAIPAVRPFATDVRDGILTVDGMTAKVDLNYNIHQPFLYFTVPGVGTAIVAQTRFMNAAPQKDAFHGNVLTIQVNGHTVELTSANPIAGKEKAEAWVAIDPLFGAGQYPHMGFGEQQSRPYAWPGSKAEASSRKDAREAVVLAPPMPKSLLPKPETASTYSVTVPASDPGKK